MAGAAPYPVLTGRDADRLWAKVERRSEDECWPWTASRDLHGYGRLSVSGKPLLAHRLIAALAGKHGPEVRHTCHRPPCCNPAHLLVGTHADNMRDMAERHRCMRGHDLSETAQTRPDGTRYCRECQNARRRVSA